MPLAPEVLVARGGLWFLHPWLGRSASADNVLKTHPDKVGPASLTAFLAVEAAYECLIDPDKRSNYDRMLQAADSVDRLKEVVPSECKSEPGTDLSKLFMALFLAGRPSYMRWLKALPRKDLDGLLSHAEVKQSQKCSLLPYFTGFHNYDITCCLNCLGLLLDFP